MTYRKLKSDKLFDGFRFWAEDSVLIVDEEGVVQDILPEGNAGGDVETLKGILCPGFINCHCHLELSGMKGMIPPKTGLVPFLIAVVTGRDNLVADKQKSIEEADKEMWDKGIAAVADICNTADAVVVKKGSRLQWYSLVEVLNFRDNTLNKQMELYGDILAKHVAAGLPGTLTPHAPYSISRSTFAALNKATANTVISIHNQETGAEDELFKTGGGEFLKLFGIFGSSISPFAVSGRSSLQTWLPHFTERQTILLVHNTFIKEEDILFAKEHAATWGLNLVYCLCPNANLYIEDKLPPIDLLLKHNCTIVLGTDSYSSNWELSIASEVQAIRKHFIHIPSATVLQWATSNGAAALGWNNLGSFQRGKRPGVCLLIEDDFSVQRVL